MKPFAELLNVRKPEKLPCEAVNCRNNNRSCLHVKSMCKGENVPLAPEGTTKRRKDVQSDLSKKRKGD
jgi:hypothetical protein